MFCSCCIRPYVIRSRELREDEVYRRRSRFAYIFINDVDPWTAKYLVWMRIRPKIEKIPKKNSTWKLICSKKLLIMLCMSLLFMCVKQKCNFYFKDTIFWWLLSIFKWVSHVFERFFCYPDSDPGRQNDVDLTRSGSTSLILYRGAHFSVAPPPRTGEPSWYKH